MIKKINLIWMLLILFSCNGEIPGYPTYGVNARTSEIDIVGGDDKCKWEIFDKTYKINLKDSLILDSIDVLALKLIKDQPFGSEIYCLEQGIYIGITDHNTWRYLYIPNPINEVQDGLSKELRKGLTNEVFSRIKTLLDSIKC